MISRKMRRNRIFFLDFFFLILSLLFASFLIVRFSGPGESVFEGENEPAPSETVGVFPVPGGVGPYFWIGD